MSHGSNLDHLNCVLIPTLSLRLLGRRAIKGIAPTLAAPWGHTPTTASATASQRLGITTTAMVLIMSPPRPCPCFTAIIATIGLASTSGIASSEVVAIRTRFRE